MIGRMRFPNLSQQAPADRPMSFEYSCPIRGRHFYSNYLMIPNKNYTDLVLTYRKLFTLQDQPGWSIQDTMTLSTIGVQTISLSCYMELPT